ncbi:hypothetical protein EYF80_004586 [Liparis tanakae]|uniref:Uncharacterized protein n=1 Tax=Liparis tanakae TaxID=230148 RepID=A0A4Z2J4Y7_9TELE|nr:hypothetical protein EYF80_004586 [Liparis tanakae]
MTSEQIGIKWDTNLTRKHCELIDSELGWFVSNESNDEEYRPAPNDRDRTSDAVQTVRTRSLQRTELPDEHRSG